MCKHRPFLLAFVAPRWPCQLHAIPLSLLSRIPVDLAAILRVLVLCTVTANLVNTVLLCTIQLSREPNELYTLE